MATQTGTGGDRPPVRPPTTPRGEAQHLGRTRRFEDGRDGITHADLIRIGTDDIGQHPGALVELHVRDHIRRVVGPRALARAG